MRALERKVNGAEMERPADLMYIHEMLVNLEKFRQVRVFCRLLATGKTGANLHGMMRTASVNVGIDDDLLNLIICFEFPRDLSTVFQEQGHRSRQEGSPSKHILMYCLSLFN